MGSLLSTLIRGVKSFACIVKVLSHFFLIRSAELQAEFACQKSLKSLMIRESRFSVPASHAGVQLRKVSFMVNLRQPRDVAQILLSVLFLALMIIACLWIVQ
ncbi:MAG: hypothetical protein E7E83_10200, partial [Enterobacter ludwigii]|nr:hypothetical protein [Enterobacter ludwigii]